MYNTEKEIRDELNSISKCLQLVCGKEDEILRTFSGARRMWFIGSGSSFCLAKSAAAMFTMRCTGHAAGQDAQGICCCIPSGI